LDIPRYWRKAEGDVQGPDGNELRLKAWGWSSDGEGAARDRAKDRLSRLITRVKNGEPLPERYEYGSRPIREEVLEEFRDSAGLIKAVLTRNTYGSRILNATRLLFIDVDLKTPGLFARLLRRLKGDDNDRALDQLRGTLERFAPVTFRVYRTAAGLRAMSVSHVFSADAPEAYEILCETKADPAFVHLCRLQQSFRARLTPKFWRCGMRGQPPAYPREDARSRDAFHTWLREYQRRSGQFATCEYLETVGAEAVHPDNIDLLRLHDRQTRASERLPLA
jgi:hypothetical protein